MAKIERSIDVEVPVRTAYNQWTQFEEFPRFMEAVEDVRQMDDTRLRWRVVVAGQPKEWTAEITEQIPDARIAWRSLAGARNAGVVTFHRLSDARSRVMLQLEYEPEGMLETVGDAAGVVSRRVVRDLERFKAFVEERGRETGAWRGAVARPDARQEVPAVTEPAPWAPAKGSEVRLTRCEIHGIAFDAEREECPSCAAGRGRAAASGTPR
jgi:uncharacterized membrane protein